MANRMSAAVCVAAIVWGTIAAAGAAAAEATGTPQGSASGAVAEAPRGNPFRSRPLASMDRLYAPHRVVDLVADAQRRHAEVRVLEFGMGEGRVLLELRRRFPTIELHGINKTPWRRDGEAANAAWLRESAVFFGLFDAEQAAAMRLPVLHFHDVNDGDLGFLPSDYFDVVITQVSFGYIDRKDRLLEEFWRILRPGGVALTDLDNLLLMGSGNALDLETFFARVAAEGPDVAVHRNGPFPYLVMRRNQAAPLALRLEPTQFKWPIFADPRGFTAK